MGNNGNGAIPYEEEGEIENSQQLKEERVSDRRNRNLKSGGHRYITNSEAIEILGGDTWKTLLRRLQNTQQELETLQYDQLRRFVDFQLFANIIRSRFEKVVMFFDLFKPSLRISN